MALDRTAPGLTFQARAEIDKYLSAYAKDPKSRVFAALAEAYRRAGMKEEAIKVAEEGLRFHPNLPSALVTLGRAYFEAGDSAKARPLLERVAQQSPDNLAAQRALAELYLQAGETQLARSAFQAILRANPADPEAQTRLKELNMGSDPKVSINLPPPAPAGPPAPVRDQTALGERVPSPAQPPQPAPVPAQAAAQEKTQAAPVASIPAIRPAASPPEPSPAPKPLNDQQKIDLFFESVDVTRPAPAATSLDYEVRSAPEIFSDLEEEKKRSPITTETLARLLLKQGYPDKARVIFEEILAGDPSRQELAREVSHLRQELGLPPLDPSTLSRPVPPRPPVPPSPKPAPPAPKGARVPSMARMPSVVQVPTVVRVPSPAQPPKFPPTRPKAASAVPVVARVPSPASPPTKIEKIEALKSVLEHVKKGKKP